LVRSITAALAHRGPDGEGHWVCAADGIGLGNRRLAIVDRTSAGTQPMTNEDGSIRVTFNGEVYNHLELRAELTARGHIFTSKTDTEAVVHAYEQWGLDCFTRLIGMWAVAIWDGNRKRLVLSRDRLGIKPLYYLLTGAEIRFASEIKALFVDPALVPHLDLEALSLYLTYMITPTPRTLFRDIQKLPAATILVVEQDREPRTFQYWDPLEACNPYVEHAAGLPAEHIEDFAVEAVSELLQTSIRRRLMADVPVGLFLSGGVDSSVVAALTRRQVSGRLATFSAVYNDVNYCSDLPHARRVASLLECEHHEVVLTEQTLIDCIDDVVVHLDEPNACWVSTPIYALAREARRSGVGVILNGEGSDEIFCGYEGYLRATQLARLAAHPLWGAIGAPLAGSMLAPLFAAAERYGGRARGTRDDFERLVRGEPAFIGLQVALTEQLKSRVLRQFDTFQRPAHAMQNHISYARTARDKISGVPGGERLDEVRWIGYVELKHRLPEMLLTRLDKMTMAHGVEGRVPFLDHELVEFALALPGSLRMRGGVTKYLLRRAAEQWLPHDIIYRRKIAFGAPVATWLKGRLGHRVESQMEQSELVRCGVLDGEVLQQLLAVHRTERADNAQAIWALYSVARWYDLMIAPGHFRHQLQSATADALAV
jgi:asparagine synthase (glutamine-hydrolysing)